MPSRITIQTSAALDGALEEARHATGRASKSDVVRDGLELYDLVLQHLKDGKHLYLGATSETASEVVLPHLERAAGRSRPTLSLVAAPADEAAPAPVAARPHTPARGADPHAK